MVKTIPVLTIWLLSFLTFFVPQTYPTNIQNTTTGENQELYSNLNCNASSYAGDDQYLCAPGGSVNLSGIANGDFCDFYWTPSAGLSNPRSTNTSAWVTQTTTYNFTVVGDNPNASNLLFNGDFESGDVGFRSNYYWDPSGVLNEEAYFITNRGDLAKWDWAACADHTSNSGNMMCVNASTLGGVEVWCQTVNVEANTDYIFSLWLVTLHPSSPAQLEFRINGEVIGPPFSASPNTCEWEQNCSAWFSGNSTVADVCIINLNTESWGNDFAIDDLSFKEACVARDSVTVHVLDQPDIQSVQTFCTSDNLYYQVRFEVPGGGSGAYEVLGLTGTWQGDVFTSAVQPTGTAYDFTVRDLTGCGARSLQGQYTCACITDAGTLAAIPQEVCDDEIATIVHNGDLVLDGNDVLRFVLHDQPGPGLGTIIASSTQPVFSFMPGMQHEQVYYVSAVAGNNNGFGDVSYSDQCLSISLGVPIQFYAYPDGGISAATVICQGDSVDLKFDLGPTTYDILFSDGQTNFELKNIRNGDIRTFFPTQTSTYTLLSVRRATPPFCERWINRALTVSVLSLQPAQSVAGICAGDSIYLANNWQRMPGSFLDTFPSVLGCDSIVETLLSIHPPDTVELDRSSCDPTAVGRFVQVEQNRFGCDSTVITRVQYAESDTTDLERTTCMPQDTGWVLNWLVNQNNCDSLVRTYFRLLPPDTTYTYTTSCMPQDTGWVQNWLVDQDNCDSLVRTYTRLLPIDTTYVYSSSCTAADTGWVQNWLVDQDNCDSLVWTYTRLLSSDTTYEYATSCSPTDTGWVENWLLNQNNCDSLVWTYIRLLPSNTTYQSQTSCSPADTGLSYVNLLNQYACDSLLVIHTTLVESDLTELFYTSCDPTQAGVVETLYPNRYGCDSLVVETTTALVRDTNRVERTTCDASEAGEVQLNLTNQYGCDSTIFIKTIWIEPNRTTIDLTTCDPLAAGRKEEKLLNRYGCDSLVITITDLLPSDTLYFTQTTCDSNQLGIVSEQFTNEFGCDSIHVTTTLALRPDWCIIEYELAGDVIDCTESDGSFSIVAKQGQPPFDYQWQNNAAGLNGVGQIEQIDVPIFFSALPAGNYEVTLTSYNGYADMQATNIIEEERLEIAAFVLSDYQGEAISCAEAKDGEASVEIVAGGIAPFSYVWSTGMGTAVIDGLGAGQYSVTVSDSQGCTAEAIVELVAPDPLTMQLGFSDVRCFGNEDGTIEILSVEGGVGPYEYALNGRPYSDAASFSGLGAGTYQLQLRDANACETEDLVLINAPVELFVELGRDTSLRLGDSLEIRALVNVPVEFIQSYEWTGTTCENCPELSVRPFVSSSYQIHILNENGCEASDDINIGVVKERNVYFPNVFTPNGDGFNDVFYPQAGPDVKAVRSLRIFNRWGDQVFEIRDFQPNDPRLAWDGFFKGTRLDPAVFVYSAEVEFIDGERVQFSGDVAIVR